MHEWALAEAVLDSVREHSAGRRVSRVVLRFGELQQIDREIFDFALRELGGELGSARFEIESEPARFACNACGAAWSLDERWGPRRAAERGDPLPPRGREGLPPLPGVRQRGLPRRAGARGDHPDHRDH